MSGSNFTQRIISDLDIEAAGAPLVIRGADGSASVPSILLNGTVRGIDFSSLNFQMTGWPSDHSACLMLGTGTFGKLRFLNGTTFRHGYGPGQNDFDTVAELPEYERIDNVATAATENTAHPLIWKDPSAPTGWIEFFNRGTEMVHVAVGPSNVTASTADIECAPGARIRINSLDPDLDTHFAIIAPSGASEVNARTEIGLSEYLANALRQTGGAVLEEIEFRNCLFRDLSNAAKGLRPTAGCIMMDCDFDRIYQDIIALAPEPGVPIHILRNIESLPFARTGIAEELDGDARDPHGDQFQMFENSASGTVGPVFYAGNRIRLTPRRQGIRSQGIFVSDNDFDPSFTNLFFISTMQIGGSGRALSLGEEGTNFKVRDAFVYGVTAIDASNPSSDLPFISIDHDGDGTVYVAKCIASELRVTDADWQSQSNFTLSDAQLRDAVFPNLDNLPLAYERAEIEAAMVSAAEGEGLGAIATGGAVDWTTSDHAAVIRWESLPSGAHWNALENQPADSLIVLPLRKILNRLASQSVVPASGTEWRSVSSDGTTEVQAWTDSNGTIEPDQFIQVRRRSAALEGETATASIAINGFTQGVSITSASVPTEFLTQGDPVGYFQDPANVPAGTSRITARGQFNVPFDFAQGVKLFAQVSTGCDLTLQPDGSLKATIEDGTGAKMLTNFEVVPAGLFTPNTWHTVEFDVDQAEREVRVFLNGSVFTTAFAVSGNSIFQSNRAFVFAASANGNTPLPTGTRIANLSVDLDGTRHKTVGNTADEANADPWKRAGDFA
ncbi:hypothetical protein [Erythrobacter sp. NAP1]|uniref:hypothetical protein n=1 Tax=Erythrobacter sp. NAP1 TaxID=237727 RepID=UPI0012EA6ED6|nr:hypothetical protein [Erythrobacter sp. NAP1]